jgi:hypothetical protein
VPDAMFRRPARDGLVGTKGGEVGHLDPLVVRRGPGLGSSMSLRPEAASARWASTKRLLRAPSRKIMPEVLRARRSASRLVTSAW